MNKIKIKLEIFNIIVLIKFLILYLNNILIIALAILFSRWEKFSHNRILSEPLMHDIEFSKIVVFSERRGERRREREDDWEIK